MERLTERRDGWVMRNGCHGPCRTCHVAGCADISTIIERLAAYEDTGLMPEEVTALQASNQELKKEALPLLQAKIQDRLMVLPCKVQDVVYEVNKRGFISTYKVISIHLSACSILIGWELIDGLYTNLNGFEASAIGKTVFLTREEAEAAPKKREED